MKRGLPFDLQRLCEAAADIDIGSYLRTVELDCGVRATALRTDRAEHVVLQVLKALREISADATVAAYDLGEIGPDGQWQRAAPADEFRAIIDYIAARDRHGRA